MISLLSDETINQIAAGEVIESPASVVKELVENALDARATKITIEIKGGGLKSIKIIDDGKGIHPEDVPLTIVRHATSKIKVATDLFTIMTKGFRGEALASIASISKMKLLTALKGDPGTSIEVEAGEILQKRSCARTHGTTIEVHSLFFNVPARKKFQRSSAAISAEIFRMVTIMALSHPDVQFELISNGRCSIKTMSLGLELRIKELLGQDFVEGSFPLQFEEGSLYFQGFIGSPINTRANKMGQYLFLNQRAVFCDAIQDAVREGYGTRLDSKRHPLFVLHLDVPPDLVDVNVHPQKLQVRLRKEDLFREKVKEAVEKALATKKETSKKVVFEKVDLDFTETALCFEEKQEFLQEELPLSHNPFEVLAQSFKYLFLEEPDFAGVVLLDMEAARYRILFDELSSQARGSSQGLLVPFNIDLTMIEATMVLTHMDAITDFGFSLKPIGKAVFMVEAIPPFIEEKDVKKLVAEIAAALQEFIGKEDYANKRKKKLAMVAAHFAKKAGNFTKEEGKELLKKLEKSTSPLHDPKGNPTKVYLSYDKIESFFTAKTS